MIALGGCRRREQAVPRHVVEPGHAGLRDRRNIGRRRRAFGAADCDAFELAAFHLRQHRRHAVEHQGDLAGQQVGERGGGALVRDMHHVDACHGFQHFHAEMVRAARPDRRVIDRAGTGFRERDEFLDRIGRKRGMEHQDLRIDHHQTHRRQVLEHVVGQLRVEGRGDRHAASRSEEQRMAVRARPHDRFYAHDAAGARAIVHDHLLAPGFGELLRDGAPDDIGRPARREMDDQADGLGWIGLRGGGVARRQQPDGAQHGDDPHGSPVVMPVVLHAMSAHCVGSVR